ncbi:MAG: THUMP domain-containing protein [Desulfurococcus sp.]|nr:THUMP domain-containing protein [Desulfurococcus sp.]
MAFNLLITHEPGLENFRLILSKLRSAGLEHIMVDKGSSVILLRVKDPYEFVSEFRSIAGEIPVVYRVIPVDAVTDPYVEVVAEKSGELAESRIPSDKTFRVTLNGRLYWLETRLPAHTMDAVRVIAEKINRPVSLTSPDYLVYIRSVKLYHRRRYAAITVTTPDKILTLKSGRP